MSVKRKAILTAAMFLASLATSALPASPVSTVSAEAVSAGKALAEANGIVLDSDADAAELAVLHDLNGGVLPLLRFGEDRSVKRIGGLISDREVRSRRDARAVLTSVADLLGIQDTDAELTFFRKDDDEDSTAYVFRQVYQGIELDSAYVTLYVNSSTGKANYLNSSFVSGITVGTEPAVTAGQVRSIVRKEYDTGLQEEAKLVIWQQDDGTVKLAYAAKTNSEANPVIYVDAMDGSILYAMPEANGGTATYTYNSGTANPVTGTYYFQTKTQSYNNNGSTWYRMVDPTRNIWIVYESFEQDACGYYSSHGITGYDSPYINTVWGQTLLNQVPNSDLYPYVPCSSNNNWSDSYGIMGVLYQVERAYDYYKNVFQWKGTDNVGSVGGKLFVFPALSVPNAYANLAFNHLKFGVSIGSNYHFARDIGIVAHEYTHRVSNNIALWAGSTTIPSITTSLYGEAACLSEAYGDIMGEYAKMYYNTGSYWKVGNKIPMNGAVPRDITKGDSADSYHSTVLFNSTYYFRLYAFPETPFLEAHEGSTIISYAAYKMDKYGIPQDIARKIWFKSMNYLTKGRNQTDFRDCRDAVSQAAQEVINATNYDATTKKNMMIKVHTAFNNVQVIPYSTLFGNFNGDNSLDYADVAKIRAYVQNPSILSNPEQISMGDVDFDGQITWADANKLQNYLSNGGSLW